MNERVIEPSEIIVEGGKGFQKENTTRVNPWIRCLARFFDYSLFFLLLLLVKKVFFFSRYEALIPFEYFIWIPVEAALLSTWGTTPGKFFLKTRLKAGKRGKLDFMSALRRSFSVWFRGMGMGLPVLNFFCLLIAYNKLKVLQITSWDRDDHVQVTHYPIGRWRVYLAVFVAVVGILYYYKEKNTELIHVRSLHEYSPPATLQDGSLFSAQNGGCHWSYRV